MKNINTIDSLRRSLTIKREFKEKHVQFFIFRQFMV
jgi:hypothetical protein